MILLALDVGNSAVKAGLFRDGVLEKTTQCAPEQFGPIERMLAADPPDGVGMVSVVPGQSDWIRSWVREQTGSSLVELSATSTLPFRMDYETPFTLGADRVAAAAGAWVRREGPTRGIVAVDAGTAVTIDVVTYEGAYLGGIIAPGPDVLRRALRDGTAQLPLVELDPSAPLIGRTTTGAIQSGIMNGFAASVDGMLRGILADLEGPSRIFLTGGWSEYLRPRVRRRSVLAPHLVLEGVRVLYELNAP